MKPLTERMLHVLRELAKPNAVADYMRYMGRFCQNPYYFLSTSMERCSAQIDALRERGLVRFVPHGKYGDGHAEITEAGRRFLKEQLAAARAAKKKPEKVTA